MIKPNYDKGWTICVSGDFVTICRADAMLNDPGSVRVVHIHYQGYPVISKVQKSVRTFTNTPDGVALDRKGTWDCGSLDDALGNERGVIVVSEAVAL